MFAERGTPYLGISKSTKRGKARKDTWILTGFARSFLRGLCGILCANQPRFVLPLVHRDI